MSQVAGSIRRDRGRPTRTQLAWSLIVLLWVPMAAFLLWGKGGVLELLAMRKEVRALQAEITRLESENAKLRAEIQRVQTDPSSVERLARERFFMKKPGERVIYIPNETPPTPDAPAPTGGRPPEPAHPKP